MSEAIYDLAVDTQPRTLILNETDITDTTSEVLDTMGLNGKVPTFDELKKLDIRNTIVQVGNKNLQILCLSSGNNTLSITAGYYLGSDGAYIISIEISVSQNSSISLLEL